jgi:hypothetical protein
VNIFAVNNDPYLAAKDLPDKLVTKMPTEGIQMLIPWAYNSHEVYILKPDGTRYGTRGFAYHPCSRWLYEDPSNVVWLFHHSLALCEEYTSRYGKQHGTLFALGQLAELITDNHPEACWEDHTEFVQAMPDEFRVPGDPVQAYRNYINGYKGYAVWAYSEKPEWWDEEKHEPVRQQYLQEREAKRMKRQHEKSQKVSRSIQNRTRV